MSESIYAAFNDPAQAERAAGALLDHGVPADKISLVVSESAKKKMETWADAPAMGSQPTIVSGPGSSWGVADPLGNEQRLMGATPPIQGGNQFPIGETAEVDHDLNPAQNDYPRSGTNSPTELSSRPPESRYDWNRDLDKKDYNADYESNVDRENRTEYDRDRERTDPASVRPENDESVTASSEVTPPLARGTDYASASDGHPFPGADYDHERAAKAGVSTTTIQDAAKGAAKGVGIGLGVGALAAVASIAVPGVGFILGGSALALATAGLAATAGAGAVAGGVVGYLKDQGVPADQITAYQTAYEDGGAILSVECGEAVDRTKVEAVLSKYGASNVKPFGYAA